MQPTWFLSKSYLDPELGHITPHVSSYAGHWRIPLHSLDPDGWALCVALASPHQKEAAKQDPRIVVLPLLFDPRPVPDVVIDTYAHLGAKEGMSLSLLLATLAETEPGFGQSI